VSLVIVSTDSIEYAKIANLYGAEVPFMRPVELATDSSPEWLSWQHALNYLRDIEGGMPKIMLSIPATAPLRKYTDIEKTLDEYHKGNCDVAITMTDSHRNPFFNMLAKDEFGNFNRVINTKIKYARRQDAPTVYDMTTVAYVTSPAFVMENSSIFDGRLSAVYIPLERAMDIDTLLDFKIAELTIQGLL
jgi:N-acylneuraminate cytidylyltransferase